MQRVAVQSIVTEIRPMASTLRSLDREIQSIHQRAVQALLAVATFPRYCKMVSDLKPPMPRREVPGVFQAAIQANWVLCPEEVQLLEVALALEEPDAVWERLSPVQGYFYNSISFGMNGSDFTAWWRAS